MVEVKLFNRWDTSSLKVEDPGLISAISTKAKIVPKTGAEYAGARFHKSDTFIVERLINKLMVTGHRGKKHKISSGHNTGKKDRSIAIVKRALEMIENETKQNPIQVFIKALENAAPREEVITIEYGGARYPKAVDVSPQRRVDVVLRQMAQGAYSHSFNKKISIERALSREILNAYNLSANSAAISKKRDLERQAVSSK